MATTTAEKLAEAEAALHKLLTGTKMVEVGYGDTKAKYSEANIKELRLYISELRALSDPTKYKRRPFGVLW